jgi:hypothetical protein
MPIATGQTSIGLTPTMIDGISQMPFRILLQNMDQTTECYIGGADVTINNGYRLDKSTAVQLVVNPLDAVYAVSVKNGHNICWLREVL